jgi:hypothetical protein
MSIDYLAEAEVHVKLERNGVRPDEHDLFLQEFRDNKFTPEEMTAEWFEARRAQVPHRFIGGSATEEQTTLAREAFVLGNVGAQTKFVKLYGEADAKAHADRYQNPFSKGVIGKPGVETEADKKSRPTDDGKNPFAPSFTDAKGRYTAAALTAQGKIVRALGLAKANQIASVWGQRVGSTGIRK